MRDWRLTIQFPISMLIYIPENPLEPWDTLVNACRIAPEEDSIICKNMVREIRHATRRKFSAACWQVCPQAHFPSPEPKPSALINLAFTDLKQLAGDNSQQNNVQKLENSRNQVAIHYCSISFLPKMYL